jgi:predicted alpha/beta-fold hydrolase
MADNDRFIPPRYLQGRYTQTVLASAKIRAVGRNPMMDSSQEMIIHAGDGVRLQGFFSPHPARPHRGMVVLLHGWEGSAESTYILHSGRFFYEKGFSVFRLNYRDHGNTHHLNEGIFRAIMLDEVFNAVKEASDLTGNAPCLLMGFSLGGNFALRIARRCTEKPIANLRHIMSVSPVINPGRATDAIDRSWLLRSYFLKKWRRSLALKQECFPHLYDFTGIMTKDTIRSLTDALFERYNIGFDTESYFREYAIGKDALEKVNTPTTIVTARDDPAIPADDFPGLRLSPHVRLIMHEYGGHNGFLEGVFAPTWYEKKALGLFPGRS